MTDSGYVKLFFRQKDYHLFNETHATWSYIAVFSVFAEKKNTVAEFLSMLKANTKKKVKLQIKKHT